MHHTSVRQQTVALVSSHIIDAGALVEAGVGGTLVDVSLAVRSYGGRIRDHTWVRCGDTLNLREQGKRKGSEKRSQET